MIRTSHGRTDYATEQQQRLKSAQLFAKGFPQAEVARQFGVSRQTTSRWFHIWQAGGITALKGAGRVGRKSKLSGDDLCRLEAQLLEGARARGHDSELWTLQRIAHLIQHEFGVSYHPSHVWKVLRQLGWSCQRPTRRARERDEAAIKRWVRYRWPRIKKRPANPNHS